jgi:hypothetical protein
LNRSLPLVICHLSFGASVIVHSGLTAPIQPRIISITTSKVAALTGPQALSDQKGVDVCGTDVGIMTKRLEAASGNAITRNGYIPVTLQYVHHEGATDLPALAVQARSLVRGSK